MSKEKNKIGLVVGSFQPLHKGHWDTIMNAVENNDKVVIFVSNKTRKKTKDDYELPQNLLNAIWKYTCDYIKDNKLNILIENSNTPLNSCFSFIENNSNNSFTFYCSEDDFLNRKQAFERFIGERKFSVSFCAVNRIGSATEARKFLHNKDYVAFNRYLPSFLEKEKLTNLLLKTDE